ncbi:MAG: alpha/beta fold hydrolase [Anaerolineae bacterium]
MEKRRGCLWWSLRIIGAIVLLFIVLGAVGCIYESRGSAAEREKYPPPGTLVEVDGRMMHIHCEGSGSPTVVLDAGQGGWSVSWSEVMPAVSQITQTCAYDRAGYGWSDPANDGRTPQEIADDVIMLLDAAEIDGPIILGGFSYTGLSTRLAAAQNPDLIKGMLLVDPATEFDNEISGPELLQQQQSAVGIFQFFGLMARMGVVRLLDPEEMAPSAPFIPENALEPEIYYSFVAEPAWWETSTKEFVNRLNDDVLQDIRTNGQIPDIPLVIIGAESVSEDESEFVELSTEHLAALETLAAQSSQGQYILADNSTHEVPRDRPDIIIEALTNLVEQTK